MKAVFVAVGPEAPEHQTQPAISLERSLAHVGAVVLVRRAKRTVDRLQLGVRSIHPAQQLEEVLDGLFARVGPEVLEHLCLSGLASP